jgi:hypothetical protein
VTLPSGPRAKKETLFSNNIELVRPHLTDGFMLEVNFKKAISWLHTSAVAQALCASTLNKVLGRFPPSVNPEEETLSRFLPLYSDSVMFGGMPLPAGVPALHWKN